MNVVCTKYKIVKYVGEKVFNWKLSEKVNDNWDVCWVDSKVPYAFLGKMKPYQRINHFPGMFYLSKKNYLCNNLNRMRKIFPRQYDFYPKTWLLPADSTLLQKYMQVIWWKCFVIFKERKKESNIYCEARSLEPGKRNIPDQELRGDPQPWEVCGAEIYPSTSPNRRPEVRSSSLRSAGLLWPTPHLHLQGRTCPTCHKEIQEANSKKHEKHLYAPDKLLNKQV